MIEKEKIEIKVDNNTMLLLEALHFDYNAYLNLLKTIIINTDIREQEGYKYNEKTYRIFMDEYREIYSKYELLKKEIIESYVPDEYKKLYISFNFEKSIVEIYKR